MKKILFSALITFLLLSSFAFTNKTSTNKISGPVFKVMEVTYLYPLLKSNYAYNYEKDKTWLETGLRANYGMAKPYASIGVLETTFGERVFLSGPHIGDMNWESPRQFGHYNPAFVNKLTRTAEEILKNGTYKTVARKVYQDYFGDMMDVYAYAYVFLQKNPEMKQKAEASYRQFLDSGTALNEDYYALSRQFRAENPNFDYFDADTAPYFWLRRSMDGTDDEFSKLLRMVFEQLN